MSGQLSPCLHRPLASSLFFILAILTGVERYLVAVWTCISLRAKNTERLLVCLSAICISSPVKCFYMCFAYFSNWIVCFFLLSLGNSLYNLFTSPLSDRWFANIFSCSVTYLFILLGSFAEQNFKILMKSNLSIFPIIDRSDFGGNPSFMLVSFLVYANLLLLL